MKCNENGDRHRKAKVRSRGEQDRFKKKKKTCSSDKISVENTISLFLKTNIFQKKKGRIQKEHNP
jgi:hypothetical protein